MFGDPHGCGLLPEKRAGRRKTSKMCAGRKQMVFKHFQMKLSDQRRDDVINEVAQGSQPATRFYMMVAVSTLIACVGLVAGSTAVIIGAMLVAPLMTPIFGISLALVRGSTATLGKAARAEVVGIVVAVGLATGFGFLPIAHSVTAPMLARAAPNLLDLLVAVLAGFAGAYSIVDEKSNPVLPGVAIATAIVPPLANVGLFVSLGRYADATGSFLLFVANFLSILIVAACVFVAAGMAPRRGSRTAADLAKRFSIAVAGFVVVATLLTSQLARIVGHRQIERSVREAIETVEGLRVLDVHHLESETGSEVLVETMGTTAPAPDVVGEIEAEIGVPVKVSFRAETIVTKDG
jgi:uncharacterized hydrophobic protein (TIGR00271 family)